MVIYFGQVDLGRRVFNPGVFMSIDLLHRISASERRFRCGRGIIGEFVVDEAPDEESEMELRKRGSHIGSDYLGYYEDEWGKRKASHVLYSELVDQFKEP
jgi:hypothetical protein